MCGSLEKKEGGKNGKKVGTEWVWLYATFRDLTEEQGIYSAVLVSGCLNLKRSYLLIQWISQASAFLHLSSFHTSPLQQIPTASTHPFGVQAAKPGLLTPEMRENVSSANPSSGELAHTVLSSVSALKIASPEAAQNSPHYLILQKPPSKHLADEC